MSIREQFPSHSQILLSGILVSLGARLWMIFFDSARVINQMVLDDAFYYFALTKHILAGHGPVFNQGIPTNGFHPLYELFLLPIFATTQSFSANFPIKISLVLLSLFTVATAVPLDRICTRILNKRAGLLAAMLWLFSPLIFDIPFTGLETPLQAFFLATLTAYLIGVEDRANLTTREAIVIGALLALVFLSRMDGIFIVIGVGLSLVYYNIRTSDAPLFSIETVSRALNRDVLTVGTTSLVLVLPWLLTSYLTVGRITPVSGSATRFGYLLRMPYGERVLIAMYQTGEFVANLVLYQSDPMAIRLVVLTLIGGILLLFAIRRYNIVRRSFATLDFLVISALFYFPFYWFYELGMRPWYGMYTVLLTVIAISIATVALIDSLDQSRIGFSILALALILSFTTGMVAMYPNTDDPNLKQKDAKYIQNSIPDDAVVAAFNTGIVQYYTPNHDVINLDGVMNPEAYRANKHGTLESYICQQDIEYIVDEPQDVQRRLNTSQIYINPIANITVHSPSGATDTDTVYKVCRDRSNSTS